jgi:hypothetical protein
MIEALGWIPNQHSKRKEGEEGGMKGRKGS